MTWSASNRRLRQPQARMPAFMAWIADPSEAPDGENQGAVISAMRSFENDCFRVFPCAPSPLLGSHRTTLSDSVAGISRSQYGGPAHDVPWAEPMVFFAEPETEPVDTSFYNFCRTRPATSKRVVDYITRTVGASGCAVGDVDKESSSAWSIDLLGSEFGVSTPSSEGASRAAYDSILRAILELHSGWDGEDSVAPTSEAKRSVVEVVSHLREFMDDVETEVDPSNGEVNLVWFTDNHRASLSVNIHPTGRVSIISSEIGKESNLHLLSQDQFDRISRLVGDAGIKRQDAELR